MHGVLMRLLKTALLLIFSVATTADETVHLLGFVERLCTDQPLCFELRVEAVYSGRIGDRIRVNYDRASQIYDPENYRLTPSQSNIVAGSHLRLLVEAVPSGYHAGFIWLGD